MAPAQCTAHTGLQGRISKIDSKGRQDHYGTTAAVFDKPSLSLHTFLQVHEHRHARCKHQPGRLKTHVLGRPLLLHAAFMLKVRNGSGTLMQVCEHRHALQRLQTAARTTQHTHVCSPVLGAPGTSVLALKAISTMALKNS
jgi:hypothetical protein